MKETCEKTSGKNLLAFKNDIQIQRADVAFIPLDALYLDTIPGIVIIVLLNIQRKVENKKQKVDRTQV